MDESKVDEKPEPAYSGKWIDFGTAEDNKMDSLASSVGLLEFAMQEVLAKGARGYGELMDIEGGRRWRFDISPADAKPISKLPEMLQAITGDGMEAVVSFNYIDRYSDPWRYTVAVCSLRLVAVGAAEYDVVAYAPYGSGTTRIKRPYKETDSDQYRDGKERVPVRYR